jgi:MFS family permease
MRAIRPEVATAVTFLVNGAVYASLVPRLPQIKSQLGLGDAAFGLALLGAGLGGLIGSAIAPSILARVPDRRAVVIAGMALAAAGVGPAFVAAGPPLAAPIVALGAAVLLIGVGDAVHDVSMNVIALALQRQRGASIMGRLHALWCAGAVGAGLVGAFAAARDVPVVVHMIVACVIAAAAQLVVARALPHAPPVEPVHGTAVRGWRPGAWVGLAIVAVAAGFIEGPPHDWSAIYLREDLGAGAGLAGIGPVSFTAAMLVSRLLTDRWIDRWGAPAVSAACGGLVAAGAILGLLVSALTGSPAAALVGFALIGCGAAPVFPLMFVAAERMPGAQMGVGAGAVSAMARIGFLAAPPVVGALSQAFGLARALSVIAVGGVVVALALPRRLRQPVSADLGSVTRTTH